MENEVSPKTKYTRAAEERKTHLGNILKSNARKKVVVAGPGTGKTFLFKEILRDKGSCLTLTFVNALVEDLALELNGLSEVKTLHSFARNLVKQLTKKEIAIFPKLPEVIEEDALALLKEEVDFNRLFHERDDKNERVEFYRRRKDYYGDYYGYSDVIFAAVRYLEVHRDRIPSYDQVVVDEFQDFNRLEVSLIDLLSERSPVLLAGDDDQALYDFKSASPEHIRSRYGDKTHGYEPFSLPFCSRCPRVVVEAANDIIDGAIKNGSLQGRITKPYHYFEDEAKNVVSDDNPTISCGQVYAGQIPWAIGSQIVKIAARLRAQFSVLIISPTKTQSHHLTMALKGKGFERIEHADKRGVKEPTLLDGLKLLLTDDEDNLGWRIAAKCLLEEKEFTTLLEKTTLEGAKHICELLDLEFKKEIKKMLVVLRKIANDKPIDEDGIAVLKNMELDPFRIMRDILTEELDLESLRYGNPAVRKIPIKTTTIESSKGLSADYVFITHFDDQYFVKDKKKGLTDKDICNFLVALTRARKKVFLISSRKAEPTFLQWIKKERIEPIVR
jgi:superfamily I DNA/RNA helicase